MKKKKESFFWTGYSDLMTSLFFIMLVLFAVVFYIMNTKYMRAEASAKQLDELKKIEKSTQNLDSNYFQYRPDYKKYVLRINVFYPVNESDISQLDSTTRAGLIQAGQRIEQFLHQNDSTKYLLIVEGQASRDKASWTTNYKLSYERALGLVAFWDDKSIQFGKNCELQISGSGDGQLQRRTTVMRERVEKDNQRFLIHILPKNIIKLDEETLEEDP